MYAYRSGNETFHVDAEGCVSCPLIGMAASKQWRITGAVRFNNFGSQVEHIPFPQCFDIKDWHYKNGKPRWHLNDIDHGTRRTQMSPGVAWAYKV